MSASNHAQSLNETAQRSCYERKKITCPEEVHTGHTQWSHLSYLGIYSSWMKIEITGKQHFHTWRVNYTNHDVSTITKDIIVVCAASSVHSIAGIITTSDVVGRPITWGEKGQERYWNCVILELLRLFKITAIVQLRFNSNATKPSNQWGRCSSGPTVYWILRLLSNRSTDLLRSTVTITDHKWIPPFSSSQLVLILFQLNSMQGGGSTFTQLTTNFEQRFSFQYLY